MACFGMVRYSEGDEMKTEKEVRSELESVKRFAEVLDYTPDEVVAVMKTLEWVLAKEKVTPK